MFNIGPVELTVVLVLALLIFGPAKLPELMGSVGHAIREFQRASRELTDVFQETRDEFSSAFDPNAPASSTATAASAEVEAVPDAAVSDATPGQSHQPDEFETMASMVEPVEPYPAEADASIAGSMTPVAESPEELETAASMLEPASPLPASIDDRTDIASVGGTGADDVVGDGDTFRPANVDRPGEDGSGSAPAAPPVVGIAAAAAARTPRTRRKARPSAEPVEGDDREPPASALADSVTVPTASDAARGADASGETIGIPAVSVVDVDAPGAQAAANGAHGDVPGAAVVERAAPRRRRRAPAAATGDEAN